MVLPVIVPFSVAVFAVMLAVVTLKHVKNINYLDDICFFHIIPELLFITF